VPAARTIAYSYDGLQRLITATESPGNALVYTYDNAGNRTRVTVNGALLEERSYNAANQMERWNYDAAGNLLSDGASTYIYDALNRPITTTMWLQQRVSSYNGDGVLVSQSANGVLTRYTQDLAAPLSQILQTTQGSVTSDYLYGLEHFASVTGGTRTWYTADALGSVRRTLADSALPIATTNYDPWGAMEAGAQSRTFFIYYLARYAG
jgi:YD repeat-containing protein